MKKGLIGEVDEKAAKAQDEVNIEREGKYPAIC